LVALVSVALFDPAVADAPPSIPGDYFYSFAPLPERFESKQNPITPAKVELGHMLFFEPRLSKNHDVPCNNCHFLDEFGVDGDPVSTGHRDQLGVRNAPTVYNSAGLVAQFWDGRATDVEDQAGMPILDVREMAAPNEGHVVTTISSIPQYVELFSRAFPGADPPVTYDNIKRAIGAFERILVTPSRFDDFLKGRTDALSDVEQRGFRRFVELGCASCHNGPTVGGATFEKLGLLVPYPDQSDQGRYDETQRDEDRMFFRTPSLRNVAKTGPYFHDGKVADLETAITLMATHQLDMTIDAKDMKLLVTFLDTLTGELPEKWIEEPELPPDGPNTPPPDESPTVAEEVK
jgi:cytochrome c peroxidase